MNRQRSPGPDTAAAEAPRRVPTAQAAPAAASHLEQPPPRWRALAAVAAAVARVPAPLRVAAWTLFWLAATAWARPLLLPDEGRYVGIAWEMLGSGEWLTPRVDGLPFLQKPPLFYWLTAASLAALGLNAWAARFASLLGGFVAAFSIYLLHRRWSDEERSRATIIALVSHPLFFAGAQFASLDMLVAGCITATVALLAHALLSLEAGRPHRRALLAAHAGAALGVLAKGLIGVVLPLLIIVTWLVARRKARTLGSLASPTGMAIFFAMTAPWFVAMQLRFPGFASYFLLDQHIRRFAGAGFNNPQPFWFFPAVLAILSLPWLPSLVRSRHHAAATTPPVDALAWSWLATVVIFFSLPESKLIGYVFPALPPLALLLARERRSDDRSRTRSHRGSAAIAVSAALGLALVGYFTWRPTESTAELAQALRDSRVRGETVFMLGRYYYDVPFIARLRDPVAVVDAWHGPSVLARDNWRKELAEAGRFDPARAANVLIDPASLPARLCDRPVSWAIGPADSAAAYAFLAYATPVATRRSTTLWRIDVRHDDLAAVLDCARPERHPLPPAAANPTRAGRG